MTESAKEDMMVLTIISVEMMSPLDPRFTETHYHRFVDQAPDLPQTRCFLQDYVQLGGKIDVHHLDYIPPTRGGTYHAGTMTLQ